MSSAGAVARRAPGVLAACLTIAVLAAACTSGDASPAPTVTGTAAPGFDQATREVQQPSDDEGGTLRVLVNRTCDLVAPVLVSDPGCADLLRATSRQLMAYASLPGRYGSVVVPDLATGPAQSSDGGLTWTIDVRDDARWSDGSPVTAQDAVTAIGSLDAARDDLQVTSVQADGQRLRIALASPQPALDQLLALPAATPTRAGLASGPFIVERPASDATPLVLTRNPAWVASSDPIRRPRVSRIEATTIRPEREALAAVRAGGADVSLITAVDATTAEQLLADPLIASSVDHPGTGAVVSLTVDADWGAAASGRQRCRQGLFSALDRRAIVDALGGVALARMATTMSAPTIASYEPSYRPFPVGDGSGDLAAASAALDGCGTSLRLAAPADLAEVAQAVRLGLARAGVDVTLLSADDPSAQAVLVRRFADVPGVWGYWQPLADAIGLPAVDTLLASPEIASTDPDVQADLGRLIDRLVLEDARLIPLAWITTVAYRPATITNVATSGGYANLYDVVNVGLASRSGEPAS